MKYIKFEIGDIIKVIGGEGTNGPLKKDELYEVFGLTEDNSQDGWNTYFYAMQPIIVLDVMNKEYRPFLGKIER